VRPPGDDLGLAAYSADHGVPGVGDVRDGDRRLCGRDATDGGRADEEDQERQRGSALRWRAIHRPGLNRARSYFFSDGAAAADRVT
jgi:hypothetical protein